MNSDNGYTGSRAKRLAQRAREREQLIREGRIDTEPIRYDDLKALAERSIAQAQARRQRRAHPHEPHLRYTYIGHSPRRDRSREIGTQTAYFGCVALGIGLVGLWTVAPVIGCAVVGFGASPLVGLAAWLLVWLGLTVVGVLLVGRRR